MKNDRPLTRPTEESFDEPNELSSFPTATWISNDEDAYGLFELNLQVQGSKGWHRWQIIRVERNDNFAVWYKDMGPRELYNADGIRILSGFKVRKGVRVHYETEDTVGDLKDAANELRQLNPYQQVMGLEPGDLLGGYQKEMERLQDRLRHPGKTVFGHGT